MTPALIAADGWVCEVNPLGGSLATLSHQGRDVVQRQDGRVGPPLYHGAVLAPWPGRVDGGRYAFGGSSYQLDITEPAREVALHGLVIDRVWDVTAHTDDAVTLTVRIETAPGYPFTIALQIEYAVSPAGLAVRLTARNEGDVAAPYGCGFHPYLLGGGPIDGTPLAFAAGEHLLTDPDRLIPYGREPVAGTPYDYAAGRAFGSLVLDDAFAGVQPLADGRNQVTFGDVRVWWDDALRWLQTFTLPDRSALAVEPFSCPSDAFNSGDDLVVLAPAGTHVAGWGIGSGKARRTRHV